MLKHRTHYAFHTRMAWVLVMALCGLTAAPAQESPFVPTPPARQEAPPDNGGGQARDDINVTQNGIIEMQIQDGDLFTVLQKLLMKTRTNIIFSPDVKGTVTVSLYDVTLEEALDVILKQNDYGFIREGRFFYVKTLDEIAQIKQDMRPIITRTYELNYIAPPDAKLFLEPLLSDVGAVALPPPAASGLDSTEGGGQALAIEDLLIVTDFEDNFEAIEAQLQRVDRRPKQVLLEATIVAADLNENNALGVDFNVLGGVDFEQIQFALGTVTIGPNADAAAAAGGAAGGGGGALGALTGGGEGGEGADDTTFGELTNKVPFGNLNDTTYRAGTNFAGRVPEGGLSVGFVTDEVTAFLRALEEVTNTSVLSNPKVIVVNKQVGRLLVGARNGYRTLTTTQTSTTETVEFLETGTELKFRPFISNDGFVRLEVTPRDSRGSVDALGLPNENTTEVTTNILIEDGHTVVIAGLFRESVSTGRAQVPLLGSIPWLGTAFGTSADGSIKQEIIILLTVRVIEDNAAYAKFSEDLLDDTERMRVGVRRGMQWTGRSRLAQAHYETALDHLASGELDKATWHIDLAIHNRPQLLDALRLREDIRQQRDWMDDASMLRDFIHRSMLSEEGLPDDRYGRPRPTMPADTLPVDPGAQSNSGLNPDWTAQPDGPAASNDTEGAQP